MNGRATKVGRFAPTPSGRMHIGNVYAMLAAWLSAHEGDGVGDVVHRNGRDQNCNASGSLGVERSDAASVANKGSRQGNANGKVLLRIEDVDGPRAVRDADKWIMDDLHWLGLDWDDEPVYQSQRTEIYEEALRALKSVDIEDVALADGVHAGYAGSQNFSTGDLDGSADASDGRDRSAGDSGGSDGASNRRNRLQGEVVQDNAERPYSGKSAISKGPLASGDFPLAYPCFCSRADLRAASAPQEGDRFLIYPGTCRKLLGERPDEVRSRLEAGKRHSWRIAVPEEGAPGSVVTFEDRVFGRQRFDLPLQVGDTVIRRSDGIFSYQLAVVVDDLLMGVNDIVRGRDLLRSTALQIWIRRALVDSGFAAKYGIGAEGNSAEINHRRSECRGISETDRSRKASKRNTEQADNSLRFDDRNAVKPNNPAICYTNATAERPVYAHLPLIDDPSGVRLAKRKHSLDLGALRADGVKPEQVIGYCAWLLGVRMPGSVHISDTSAPVPLSAREALECFAFDDIRADRSDRILAPNWADEVDRGKNGSVA